MHSLEPARVQRLFAAVPDVLAVDRPLPDLLDGLAAMTAGLVEARYSAVILVEDDGAFGAMGFAGLSREEIAAIDEVPTGHERMRQLFGSTDVLRIDDTSQRPDLAEFPAHHPRLTHVLGIRLREGERVIAYVLLADPENGAPFSEKDTRMLELFAGPCASGIHNALALSKARLAQRWIEAAAGITRDLLSDRLEDPLAAIADVAVDLSESDIVAMLVRRGDRLSVHYARGLGAETKLAGLTYPLAGMLSEQVAVQGESVIIPDLAHHPEARLRRISGVDLGPGILWPLHGSAEVLGALFLARRRGSPRFTQAELAAAGSFADHAAVSLELAAARESRERFSRLQERHQIARDLHDSVVQRLFATGLSFHQALPGVEGKTRERIEAGMAALDETVHEIRNTILSLRGDPV